MQQTVHKMKSPQELTLEEQKTVDEFANHALNAILLSMLLLESLDGIAVSPLYRKSLKSAVENCRLTLESWINKHGKLIVDINGDDHNRHLFLVQGYFTDLIKTIRNMKAHEIGIATALFKKYQQSPAKTLKRMEIKITDDIQKAIDSSMEV